MIVLTTEAVARIAHEADAWNADTVRIDYSRISHASVTLVRGGDRDERSFHVAEDGEMDEIA